jgi:DNA-binding winged helix-turn-helix (wHTH) protein
MPSGRHGITLTPLSIGPLSGHEFNSQNLNSSSQNVITYNLRQYRWNFAVIKTFGDFAFDDRRRALKDGGRPVRLSGQAADLLCLLLERPGELITREEIERRLWPDRNVDFHHSLDVVVNRLRTVLGDKGANLRYIETVPRKGYRFIEPVTAAAPDPRSANKLRHWSRRLAAYAVVAMLAAILAILFAHTRYDNTVSSHRSQVSPTAPVR